MAQRVALRQQHLANAGNLGGGGGHGVCALTCDQDVHIARQRQGGGHSLVGIVLQRRVVVISNNENSHQSTPAVLRLVTRSAAVSTLMPPPRFGGSVTLTTFRRGAMSTPSVAASVMVSSFFLAFMMLGKEA